MNNLIKMSIHIGFYIGFYCFLAFMISLIFGLEFRTVTNNGIFGFLYIVFGWIPNVILGYDLNAKFPSNID